MDSKRTINGKPFQTVMGELEQEFAKLTTDAKGNLALPIELVEGRMRSVLAFNFSFEPQYQPQVYELGGKAAIFVVVKISIFDDEGQLVCSRSHGGGADIIISKGSNSPIDMSADYKSAISDAFKKAALSFGVGSYIKMDAKESKYIASDKGSSAKKQGAADKSANTKDEPKPQNSGDDNVSFTVLELPNEKLSNGSLSRLEVKVKDQDGREGMLIIWDKAIKNADPKVIDAIKSWKMGEEKHVKKSYMPIVEKTYRGMLQFNVNEIKKVS